MRACKTLSGVRPSRAQWLADVMAIVDVHCMRIDGRDADFHRLHGLLSQGERERASDFHFERDRQRFIARRGALREILASYLDRHPAGIELVVNAFGKPVAADKAVHFSLSHSHGVLLCAVSRDAEVGCDIERRDETFANERIAEHFFSRAEVRALRSLPRDLQSAGFFNCWTRKEAFVKGLGRGLSHPLDSFDVSLAPAEPAALLRGCEGWSVASIEAVEGYAAAIVARHPVLTVNKITYRH